jgi:hypothetical protein
MEHAHGERGGAASLNRLATSLTNQLSHRLGTRGLGDARFWLPLLGGFAIAWPFAFAVNRAIIQRGRGHAIVHEYH